MLNMMPAVKLGQLPKPLLLRALLGIVCFSGFLVQFSEVSRMYFRYSTQTKVGVSVASMLRVPRLSVCWRFVDVLDFERLKKERGIEVRMPLTTKEIHELQSKLLVRDIFRYSPTPDEIYGGCFMRFPGNFYMNYFTKIECQDNLKVTRNYHREFICYKFDPRFFRKEFPINEYAYAPEYFNMMFQINFNETLLQKNEYFTAFVHENDTTDLLDSGQTRMWLRVYRRLGFSEESVSLSYSVVKNTRLPHPYDTQCVFLPIGQSKTSVEFDCINNLTLHHLNRAIFAKINTSENSTAGIITVHHLRNHSVAAQIKAFTETCKRDYESCDLSFTYSKAYLIPNPQLAVSLYIPSDPIISINHVARMILVEFLVYTCSCFGSWFGLSILALLKYSSRVGLRVMSRPGKVSPENQGTFKLIKAISHETHPASLSRRDTVIINEVLKYLNRFSHELRNDLEKNIASAETRILTQLSTIERVTSLFQNRNRRHVAFEALGTR